MMKKANHTSLANLAIEKPGLDDHPSLDKTFFRPPVLNERELQIVKDGGNLTGGEIFYNSDSKQLVGYELETHSFNSLVWQPESVVQPTPFIYLGTANLGSYGTNQTGYTFFSNGPYIGDVEMTAFEASGGLSGGDTREEFRIKIKYVNGQKIIPLHMFSLEIPFAATNIQPPCEQYATEPFDDIFYTLKIYLGNEHKYNDPNLYLHIFAPYVVERSYPAAPIEEQ